MLGLKPAVVIAAIMARPMRASRLRLATGGFARTYRVVGSPMMNAPINPMRLWGCSGVAVMSLGAACLANIFRRVSGYRRRSGWSSAPVAVPQTCVVFFPYREEPREEDARDLVGIDAGAVGQVDAEVGGLGEQILFAAEVADHQRRIDADIGGDGAQGGAFVAAGSEAAAGRGEDGDGMAPLYVSNC